MNCPACGVENREGARFCRHCGVVLVESQEAEMPSAATTTEETAPESTSAGKEAEAPPQEPPEDDETEMPEEEQLVDKEEDVSPQGPSSEEPQPEPEHETDHAAEPHPEAGAVEIPGEDVSVPDSAAETEEQPPAGSEEEVLETSSDAKEQPSLGSEQEALETSPEAEEQPPAGSEEEALETSPEAQEPQAPSPLLWGKDVDGDPLPELEDNDFSFWREEQEPLTAVEPGTVLGDRYVVVEVLDEQDHEILYHAQDLSRCWQCGFEANAADEAFCKMCGASLERKLDVRLLEVQDSKARPSNGEAIVARFVDQDRHFVLLTKSESENLSGPTLQSIRLIVGQRSDPGQIRGLDEDSLLTVVLSPTYEARTGPVLGLFAVADGMGGHAGGEVASKLALQVLFDRVIQRIMLPEMKGSMILEGDVVAHMRQATLAANDAVYLARQKGESDMGTTLTSALIRNDQVFLAHVGDCRVYRWNADGLESLTTDHSVVASMIASGQAAPEEIYTHPHRSIIYRCIGDKPLVEVDADVLPLAVGDRLILCSDGLWEAIHDEGIADVLMQEADPQAACDLLVHHANVAGGEDNISVIIVLVEAV